VISVENHPIQKFVLNVPRLLNLVQREGKGNLSYILSLGVLNSLITGIYMALFNQSTFHIQLINFNY
jgi:hypothetical protein